jgi:hypothetical protein
MDEAAGPPPPQPENAEGLRRTSDPGGEMLHYIYTPLEEVDAMFATQPTPFNINVYGVVAECSIPTSTRGTGAHGIRLTTQHCSLACACLMY